MHSICKKNVKMSHIWGLFLSAVILVETLDFSVCSLYYLGYRECIYKQMQEFPTSSGVCG